MSDQRFSADLLVTPEDFDFAEACALLDKSDKHSYSEYSTALSNAARKAHELQELVKSKGLWLLADACSMMLEPSSSTQNPFKPWAVFKDNRSAIVDDFSTQDLAFFESVLAKVDNVRLNARLADILWIVNKPKQVKHALIAIDFYMRFPTDHDGLLNDGREAIERAIRLALMLGNAASAQLVSLQSELYDAFINASYDERYRALWLADLLFLTHIDKLESSQVAVKLGAFADEAKDKNDYYRSRHHLEAASAWNKRIKKDDVFRNLRVAIAETWVSEAKVRSADSSMVAGQLYENAIKEYRNIPSVHRPSYGADERMREIRQEMAKHNQAALGEMKCVETPGIDISEMIDRSRKHVSAKPFPDVLVVFANIHPFAKVVEFRRSAEEGMNHSIYRFLCTATHFTRDGRVASRSPSLDPGDTEGENYKQAVWEDMLRGYCIHVNLVCQGAILPALQIVSIEHRMTEKVVLELCNASSLIPYGREALWAKGIYYGFENDFTLSIHLLVPQVEHLVRVLLKRAGEKTTTLDGEGIETENGLSTLLDIPKAKEVLGTDLHFELKALLVDPIGANLRNELAHGLIEADATMSLYAVYAWWLCLRLVINSIPWKTPEDKSAS